MFVEYITNKTSTGFEVKELKGGTSNVKFMWHVVANRADQTMFGTTFYFSQERFAKAMKPLEAKTRDYNDYKRKKLESFNEKVFSGTR
jgi:hypothetical protein